ncbi:hypothetical protein [Brochothrix thermosphacta]|uniref:hypothetical protein n=1 Tax=Brochothrix thermosphacta TaxID=2756 RepID=UPI00083FB6A1|nr:hypothetical protein [Brochothrix thermosphacta]ODJ66042.1 hypothetical protein BFR36_07615 [Brochothrix thermosphacta]ODJ74569.1 hypothetical protein BFR39_01100 [Brochothrix thermosphacta]ODJ75544.1 hypothetical protein BFR45_00175 [Brochothrix thermosphacta]
MKQITEDDYTELQNLLMATSEAVGALGVVSGLFETNYDTRQEFTTSQLFLVIAEIETLAPVFFTAMRALRHCTKESDRILIANELQNEH